MTEIEEKIRELNEQAAAAFEITDDNSRAEAVARWAGMTATLMLELAEQATSMTKTRIDDRVVQMAKLFDVAGMIEMAVYDLLD